MYKLIYCLVLVVIGVTFAKADEDFYNNPIYKQTVDYDAPVIDGEKTLELLKELKNVVPKDNKMIQDDVEKLIFISTQQDEDCEHSLLKVNLNSQSNSLSSRDGKKRYGENILAYIDYCADKKIKFCKAKLEKSISEKISDSDKQIIDELVYVYPNNKRDYYAIEDQDVIKYILHYLERKVDNFDIKMKKSKTRKEINDEFDKLKEMSDRVLDQIKPRGFISDAISHFSYHEMIFKDDFLKKWTTTKTFLYTLYKNVGFIDILRAHFGDEGIPVEMKDKIKNAFHLGGGGGGGGSYDPGYVSPSSFAMANF